MNQFVTSKNVLRYCVDIGEKANPIGKNTAYLFYHHLLNELDQYRNLEDFVASHTDLNKSLLEILTYVSANYHKLVTADVSERVQNSEQMLCTFKTNFLDVLLCKSQPILS